MQKQFEIEQITSLDQHAGELSELLIKVVEDGASIGFLPPLSQMEAAKYWANVLRPEVHLFIAKMNNQIVGTVQVHRCMKQNGNHRAEIAKLMTHPAYRRYGIASSLMEKAEESAKKEGCSLLVLDTREGDPSNYLYLSRGYVLGGTIPYYCRSANNELDATNLYYKLQ